MVTDLLAVPRPRVPSPSIPVLPSPGKPSSASTTTVCPPCSHLVIANTRTSWPGSLPLSSTTSVITFFYQLILDIPQFNVYQSRTLFSADRKQKVILFSKQYSVVALFVVTISPLPSPSSSSSLSSPSSPSPFFFAHLRAPPLPPPSSQPRTCPRSHPCRHRCGSRLPPPTSPTNQAAARQILMCLSIPTSSDCWR
jgi:hypothetical protein